MNSIPPARVRFAPSPTGLTHLGSARTALYNYLLARQTNGQFILRIEDTDQKRYDPDSEKDLIDSLSWLGLMWDEGPDVGGPHAPYRQSERKHIYLDYAHKLIDLGHAYPCFCTPERLAKLREDQIKRKEKPRYDGKCRSLSLDEAKHRIENGEPHVIRFKMPREGSITVTDYLRGDITVQNNQLDDFILVKSNGLAVYHLAAMVDDHLMNITHVFRGEEWLSTFPLHGHIYRAFNWQEPVWVHLSVFLNPTGKGKMSKRYAQQMRLQGNSIFIRDLRQNGYLPEAVLNWIALMGWSFDDHTEFFTLDDLVEKFSLSKLNPSPAAIDFNKLDHFNGLHIRALPQENLAKRVKPYLEQEGLSVDDETLLKIIPLIQVRLKTLDDVIKFAKFFFVENITLQPEDLIGKNMSIMESITVLEKARDVLQSFNRFNTEETEQALRKLAESLNIKAGQLFGLLRTAVTGQTVSPPLLETMDVLGKEKTFQRLENALNLLREYNI